MYRMKIQFIFIIPDSMALKTNTNGYFPSKRFVEPLPPPLYQKCTKNVFFFLFWIIKSMVFS